MIWTLLFACVGADDVSDKGDDTAAEVVSAPEPPTPPAYSGGECPEIVEGSNTGFLSAGQERSFEVKLPENAEGAPVIFAWHWLGGTASQIMRYMSLGDWAEAGAIVVAPDSCCGTFEWSFTASDDPAVDLTFYDDLLSCVNQQFSPDLSRVYTTGMSAGGLWTSYLLMHRADSLAAAAPISGGTAELMEFNPPARPLPVLLTWGGESDVYGVYSFDVGSRELSADLLSQGSWVGHCVHDGGHTIPDGATETIWRFFQDVSFSDGDPGYAAPFPEPMPAWCGLPE